jgi:hypothetical protein
MRIRSIDPVDFLLLSATERFLWIQASIPFQQPLPTQHLVQTGDASGKVVGGVEESRIAVRDFDALANQAWRQSTFQERGGMTLLEQLDCSARPNRPMTQESSYNPALDHLPVNPENKRGQQVHHKAVVVTCVKADISARFRHRANDIQGLVTVERRDLDGHHIINLSELPPEAI